MVLSFFSNELFNCNFLKVNGWIFVFVYLFRVVVVNKLMKISFLSFEFMFEFVMM